MPSYKKDARDTRNPGNERCTECGAPLLDHHNGQCVEEGAALGAATSVSAMADAIGKRLAREVFARRGNHTEAHISEAELATICSAAAQSACLHLEGRRRAS